MENKKITENNRGVALIIVAVMLLATSVVILAGFGFAFYNFSSTARGYYNSVKSYYYAEGVIEDILVRSATGKKMPSTNPYTFNYGEGSVSVLLGTEIGGSQQIIATATTNNSVRKVTVTKTATTNDANFYYGIQVGDGGMKMENNAVVVEGNVYSNGSIIGCNSGCKIAGSATVAGASNKIEDVKEIGVDAWAQNVEDTKILGNLYCQTGSGNTPNPKPCDTSKGVPPSKNMPLDQATIDGWKAAAAAGPGGPINGNYNVGSSMTLGPRKITGNLTFSAGVTLTLSGTLYVVGNVSFQNNDIVQLSSGYGANSGVIVVDGTVTVDNGVKLKGSGQAGSYLMILSTKADTVNPVINLINNSDGGIFYTSAGLLKINQRANLKEATGYKILIEQNGEVTYENGLADVSFSSGPSGGFMVTGWQEIQ
jgi:hypothetical protein